MIHLRTQLRQRAPCRKSSLSSLFRTFSDQQNPSKEEIREFRASLFQSELERQRNLVGRVEKIRVHYTSKYEDEELSMNKDLSTPYDCARHLSEVVIKKSALAQVDGELWDMHRPLPADCRLELLSFKDKEPFHLNKTFWRSCSFMLGAILEIAFKDEHRLDLISFPAPNVRSGSFVYDVNLSIPDWRPHKDELRVLSAKMAKLARAELDFERLDITEDLAREMFQHNPYKTEQIPKIAQSAGGGDHGAVTVYKVGDHVDISRGPMIANTRFLGRVTVSSVHPLDGEDIYRVQAVALPADLMLNHFAWSLIEDRSRIFNPARSAVHFPSTETPSPQDPDLQRSQDSEVLPVPGGRNQKNIMSDDEAPLIDPERQRYPFCIVWTQLPLISWLFPFIGHTGICDSRGIIYDFSGSYYISHDNMGFGWPLRYLPLSLSKVKGGSRVWDKAVLEANNEYQGRAHNIFCDNCHSHVARALNEMEYDSYGKWNMFWVGWNVVLFGRYISWKSIVTIWLPPALIWGVVLFVTFWMSLSTAA